MVETLEYNRLMMSDSCNQTSTLLNTAEIAKNKRLIKLSPLPLNKLNE